MANIGLFTVPDFPTLTAWQQALAAAGHTLIDETQVTDISQVPLGSIDMAVFLAGSDQPDLPGTAQVLAAQLWQLRQLPIFTQSVSGNGIPLYQTIGSQGPAFLPRTGVVVPVGTDPLTANWTAGVQPFSWQPSVVGSSLAFPVISVAAGVDVLGVIGGAAADPGSPAYSRLAPSPMQFWIDWHNLLLGDGSWLRDIVNYVTANVVSTGPPPTCSPQNCPSPNVCVAGQCFAPCPSGTCPPPAICQAGVCVAPCSPVSCPPPNRCVQGTCAPPCTPQGTCPPPATCQGGVCVAPCSPQNCPPPAQCIGGQCLWPCRAGTPCPGGEPCPAGGFCPPGGGGSPWPWIVALGLPTIWGLVAKLHQSGKI